MEELKVNRVCEHHFLPVYLSVLEDNLFSFNVLQNMKMFILTVICHVNINVPMLFYTSKDIPQLIHAG